MIKECTLRLTFGGCVPDACELFGVGLTSVFCRLLGIGIIELFGIIVLGTLCALGSSLIGLFFDSCIVCADESTINFLGILLPC
jgi:hypothetical protein